MSAAELMIPREWTHAYETVGLTEADLEVVDTLAASDAQSYLDGRTRDTLFDGGDKHGDAMDTFRPGRAGEVAVCRHLGLYEPDALDIHASASGDDGYDVEWRGREVDVKAHDRYADLDPGMLMVDTRKVDRGHADVYVSAQVVTPRDVVLHGWLRRSELLDIGRVWDWETTNYVAYADELHPMEALRNVSRQ